MQWRSHRDADELPAYLSFFSTSTTHVLLLLLPPAAAILIDLIKICDCYG